MTCVPSCDRIDCPLNDKAPHEGALLGRVMKGKPRSAVAFLHDDPCAIQLFPGQHLGADVFEVAGRVGLVKTGDDGIALSQCLQVAELDLNRAPLAQEAATLLGPLGRRAADGCEVFGVEAQVAVDILGHPGASPFAQALRDGFNGG